MSRSQLGRFRRGRGQCSPFHPAFGFPAALNRGDSATAGFWTHPTPKRGSGWSSPPPPPPVGSRRKPFGGLRWSAGPLPHTSSTSGLRIVTTAQRNTSFCSPRGISPSPPFFWGHELFSPSESGRFDINTHRGSDPLLFSFLFCV